MTTIKLPKKAHIPDGYHWTIEYHDGRTTFDPSKLSLHLEPEQEEGFIKGKALAERMKRKGLNANVLEYLLEHPKLIPDEWKGKYIYFWGTIYRSSDGYLFVRYLHWVLGAWRWCYSIIGSDWNSYDPAAVSVSPLKSVPKPSSDTLSLALGYLDAAQEAIIKAREILKKGNEN